jgi:hypothetical protein
VGAVVSRIAITLGELPDALDLNERVVRRAIAVGALAGAHRGRALIVRRTPTDQGQLRASWKVKPGAEEFDAAGKLLAELINDAPHIATVELGARPHKVSREGWLAIYEWVRRHYRGSVTGAGVRVYTLGGGGRMKARKRDGSLDPDIERITWAIVAKIKKHGQRPTFFVRHSTDELREIMGYELHREIGRAISKLKRDGTMTEWNP